eukprot:Skav210680  [mRNA]  locus=scaffold346:49688:51439:+ [translate_table: standard]
MRVNLEANWPKQQSTWNPPAAKQVIPEEDDFSDLVAETPKSTSHFEQQGQTDRERSPRRNVGAEVAAAPQTWERGGRVVPNPGQGDCLFHAFAQGLEALGQKKRSHRQLRAYLSAKMKEKADYFAKRWGHTDTHGQETDMTFFEYISEAARPGSWAGKFEAQILAELLDIRVLVHTSWDEIVDLNPEGKTTLGFYFNYNIPHWELVLEADFQRWITRKRNTEFAHHEVDPERPANKRMKGGGSAKLPSPASRAGFRKQCRSNKAAKSVQLSDLASSIALSDFASSVPRTPDSKSCRRHKASSAKSNDLNDLKNLSDFATPRASSHKALSDFASPQTKQGQDTGDVMPLSRARPIHQLEQWVKGLGGTPAPVPALKVNWGTKVQRAGALVQAGRNLDFVRQWQADDLTQHQLIRIPRFECQAAWGCQICGALFVRFSTLHISVKRQIDQSCGGAGDRPKRFRSKTFKQFWIKACQTDREAVSKLLKINKRELNMINLGSTALRKQYGKQPAIAAKTQVLQGALQQAATKQRLQKVKNFMSKRTFEQKMKTLPGPQPQVKSQPVVVEKSVPARFTSWTCNVCRLE